MPELVPPSVVPGNPNSRLGRQRSPFSQGRVVIAQPVVVGIDISRDRLDVAVLPGGEVFAVVRNAEGLDALTARLKPLRPEAVALEATGGDETVAAATLARVIVANPLQVKAIAHAQVKGE